MNHHQFSFDYPVIIRGGKKSSLACLVVYHDPQSNNKECKHQEVTVGIVHVQVEWSVCQSIKQVCVYKNAQKTYITFPCLLN